jgi:predicted SAM-dependent methyltransferase
MILNIGCGGRPGDKRADYGDVRIDIEEFPNVTHVLDAHRLPLHWSNKFDGVVCETALEHFDSPIQALSEMARVMRSDGSMEIIVPNVYFWRRLVKNWRPHYGVMKKAENIPDHKQAWDVIEMRNLARQVGLDVVACEFLDWLPEKTRPPGTLLGKALVGLFPHFMRKTEVRYTLARAP